MLNLLINLSNHLDSKGFYLEANYLDSIVKYASDYNSDIKKSFKIEFAKKASKDLKSAFEELQVTENARTNPSYVSLFISTMWNDLLSRYVESWGIEFQEFFNQHKIEPLNFYNEVSESNLIPTAAWIEELISKDINTAVKNKQQVSQFLSHIEWQFTTEDGISALLDYWEDDNSEGSHDEEEFFIEEGSDEYEEAVEYSEDEDESLFIEEGSEEYLDYYDED